MADQALGDAELDDGRAVAQVVVGQAEFADVAVLNRADPFVAGVLRHLSPRARVRVGADGIEHGLKVCTATRGEAKATTRTLRCWLDSHR